MDKNEFIAILDSGINIGESFEFEGDDIKHEQHIEFERWVSKCRQILVEGNFVEQEKLDRPINRTNDQRKHIILLQYI